MAAQLTEHQIDTIARIMLAVEERRTAREAAEREARQQPKDETPQTVGSDRNG